MLRHHKYIKIMKTFKSLVASVCLASAALSAQAEVDIVAPEIPEGLVGTIADGGEYYMYNVSLGKFLNQNVNDSYYCGWSDVPYSFRIDLYGSGACAFWQGSGYIGGTTYLNWYNSSYAGDGYTNMDITHNVDGTYRFCYSEGWYLGFDPGNPDYVCAPCNSSDDIWFLIPSDISSETLNNFSGNIGKWALYGAILRADARGIDVSAYVAIYNNPSSTEEELRNAAEELNAYLKSFELSEQNSWLFPSWSEYPIGLLNFEGFNKSYWDNYARYETSWQYGDTATVSAIVNVDEQSEFIFRVASELFLENKSAVTFKVYVDDVETLFYNGHTYYNEFYDSNWNYNINYGWGYDWYTPNEGGYSVRNSEINSPNYFYVDLAPGNHIIDIEFYNNSESEGSNIVRFYEMAVQKSHDLIVADIASEGTLADAITNQGIELSNVRKLKIAGSISDADWDTIYNTEHLFELDLSDANMTEIQSRQLSRYYHNNLQFLHRIVLPSSLTKIGSEAFFDTHAEIVIPNSVTEIGDYAFCYTQVSDINLPNVKKIGDGAFYGCTNLTAFSANSLEELGGAVFAYCYNCNYISINDAIETINGYSFYNCAKLSDFNLSNNIKYIKRYAFYGNEDMSISSLPPYLRELGDCAFANAFHNIPVEMLTLPEGVAYGGSLFVGASIKNITLLTNPNVYCMIGNCPSLEGIKLMSAERMSSIDNLVIDNFKDSITIYVPNFLMRSYTKDDYWQSFKDIVPFDGSEMTDLVFSEDFTFNPTLRFTQAPNFTVKERAAVSILGETGQNLNNVKMKNNFWNDYYAQVMTQTDEISVSGECEEVLYNSAKNWKFITLPFDCDMSRTYTENGSAFVVRGYDGATRAVADRFPESDHYYSDNMREDTPGNKQSFVREGADSLLIRFSASTDFESGCDYLHIKDAQGNEQTFTGSSLVSQTVLVIGDRFDIWITTDGSVTRYGYSIDAITKYVNGVSEIIENPNVNIWFNYTNNDIIPAGKGFIYMTSRDDWTHFFAVNNSTKSNMFTASDVHVALDRNECDDKQHAGWNFVGNPYHCYYDMHEAVFPGVITVWNGSRYQAKSLRDDDYVLRPLEAFFVQCPSTASEILFQADGRQFSSTIVVNSDDIYAPSARDMEADVLARQIVDLTLTIDSLTDDSRVVMNEEAQMGYEMVCDAAKFMSMDNSVPQLYSHNGGVQYAINERPVADGNVKLGVYLPKAGTYTLAVSRNQAEKVMLTDKQLDRTVELTATGYSFDAEAGTWDGRFEINVIRMMPTNIENVADAVAQDGEAVFYDMNGRMVSAAQADGIYVKVQGGKSQKVNVMR